MLGLEMVALYMASRRAMPRVLGADTPPEEIAYAADAMGVPVDRLSGTTRPDWRSAAQVVAMRAFAKYLKQAGFAQGQSTIEHALNNNPLIAQTLAAYFTGILRARR